MKKTWRWFGLRDRITLDMLRQIGIEGVVTALHEVPNGEVWSYESIIERKRFIESYGLKWSVVESLPVNESIKYAGADRDLMIENYKQSLENLGEAGLEVVVYNFMPVIDWIRTDLNYHLPDGTQTLFFDKIKFAYFDCHILKRSGAENDYNAQELEQVEKLKNTITEKEKQELVDTIIVKTQGFVNDNFKNNLNKPVELFNDLLRLYQGVDKEQLRENLKYFLRAVLPTAEKHNIRLAIHPDDPPFPVLGLPRIVGNAQDIEWILSAIPSPANGLAFCAGSLSSGLHNDMPMLARQFAGRSHFVHLRSTHVLENGNFIESSHLEGRGHLIELIQIFEQEHPGLPMRVDHGKLMLDDVEKNDNPGYSFLGRMFALAQIDGVMATLKAIQQVG